MDSARVDRAGVEPGPCRVCVSPVPIEIAAALGAYWSGAMINLHGASSPLLSPQPKRQATPARTSRSEEMGDAASHVQVGPRIYAMAEKDPQDRRYDSCLKGSDTTNGASGLSQDATRQFSDMRSDRTQ